MTHQKIVEKLDALTKELAFQIGELRHKYDKDKQVLQGECEKLGHIFGRNHAPPYDEACVVCRSKKGISANMTGEEFVRYRLGQAK